MGEDICKTKLTEDQFSVVRVRTKIFQTVETLAKTAKSLGKMFIFAAVTVGSMGIKTPKMNGTSERKFDVTRRSCPEATFVGNIVLHT